jgi:hypothetical protein
MKHYDTIWRRIRGRYAQSSLRCRRRALCDSVVKETHLTCAQLALSNSPQAAELAQLALHLTSLWLYREQAFARTLWFADEIAESGSSTKRPTRHAIAGAPVQRPAVDEMSDCFQNIA